MSPKIKTSDYLLAHSDQPAQVIANACGVTVNHVRKTASALDIELPRFSGYILRALAEIFHSDPVPVILTAVYYLNHQRAARALSRLAGFCITSDALRYHTAKLRTFPNGFTPPTTARALLHKQFESHASCHEFLPALLEITDS